MHRVLVSVAGPKNIPWFAMGREKPEPVALERDLAQALSPVIGGNRARIFNELYASDCRAVEIRFSEGKSAFYSTWIESYSHEVAETLARSSGLEKVKMKALDRSGKLRTRLNSRLSAGFYDLSKVDNLQRAARARDFIETTKRLQEYADQLAVLAAIERHLIESWPS